jgi:hypothetical protein
MFISKTQNRHFLDVILRMSQLSRSFLAAASQPRRAMHNFSQHALSRDFRKILANAQMLAATHGTVK